MAVGICDFPVLIPWNGQHTTGCQAGNPTIVLLLIDYICEAVDSAYTLAGMAQRYGL